MIGNAELVERLRCMSPRLDMLDCENVLTAADRIEGLVKEKGYALERIMELDDCTEALTAKLAKAVDALRSFRLTCNENSFYNDCTFHFIDPHALSLRLNISSDKAFIVADLEARRCAVLAALEGTE